MKFLSQMVTAASGSIGGITYSHNKGGMYQRARATPTNPGSPFQSQVRQLMADLSNAWNNILSEGQRVTWDVYAFNVPVIDSLGQQIQLTGLNMYVRSNVPRLQAGLARVDTAPLVYNLGSFTEPTATIDTANDEIDVAFTNTDEWAGETGSAMLIYASRPQNLSINFFKGPYRFAGLIPGDDTTPPTSPSPEPLPFDVGAGQRIFWRARVTRLDGRLSADFRDFANAT